MSDAACSAATIRIAATSSIASREQAHTVVRPIPAESPRIRSSRAAPEWGRLAASCATPATPGRFVSGVKEPLLVRGFPGVHVGSPLRLQEAGITLTPPPRVAFL